jgi:glycosyltransferase involved in cell wall biosynthesis
MQTNPIVSIIIPVYNRPELLKRALISVLAQSYQQWECIIVDDGSTDATIRVAQEFADKDSRFMLIKNAHGGGNKATNDGIFAAKGKYITLLGSDDEYLRYHIELRVKELDNNPTLDMVHGGTTIIGNEMVPDKRDVTKKISLYSDLVYIGGTVFAKKTVFHTLQGFKKMDYASDSDFVERAIANFNVKRVTWPTYVYYRNHSDSAADRYAKRIQQNLSNGQNKSL